METKLPFNLDWGAATPEGYSQELREALHVFNFDLSTEAKLKRAIRFTIGRILWFDKHLPPGSHQKLLFDVRGQNIDLSEIGIIEEKLSAMLSSYNIEYSTQFKR